MLLLPSSAQLFLVSACGAQLASLLSFQDCSSVVFRKHNTRDFSCNFSWYFSQQVNGPSFSGSSCKLSPVLGDTVQSHKSTAHPSFQENCGALHEEYMLYFPSAKGKWSHRDYLTMKKKYLEKFRSRVCLFEQNIPASPSCRLS